MISRATVHKATVLMNRRTNAERGPAAAGFVPVCSNVTGMFQHHLEGTRSVQEVERIHGCATLSRVVIWSSRINPDMDCVRDERNISESDRSSANCHPKSEMGTVSDDVAGFTKCVAECNFDCRMCACIAAGPALGLTSVEYNRLFWLIAALGAQLRLTANMLDGMVALVSARASKIGELYNEVRDRVSDAAVFIGAGYA